MYLLGKLDTELHIFFVYVWKKYFVLENHFMFLE